MTIDHVKRAQWIRLVECALDALDASRMMYWENALEQSDDGSYREALDSLAAALREIGLECGTMEDFAGAVEKTLEMPPEDFVQRVVESRDRPQTPPGWRGEKE